MFNREVISNGRHPVTMLALSLTVGVLGCADTSPIEQVRIPSDAPVEFRIWTPLVDEEIANHGIAIPSGASAGLIAILNTTPQSEDGTLHQKSAPYSIVRVRSDNYEWHDGYLLKRVPGDRALIWESPHLVKLFQRIENFAVKEAESAEADRREAGLAPENELGLRRRVTPRRENPDERTERVERLRTVIVDALGSLTDAPTPSSIQ